MNTHKIKPEEYMNFLKEDFKQSCFNVYGLSESKTDELLKIIYTYIQRLKDVRNSQDQTDAITDELIKDSRNPNFPFLIDYNNLCIISCWLTKALWVDPTYQYARTRLGYDQNWKNDLAIYDVMGEYVSPPELFLLLKAEENGKEITVSTQNTAKPDYSELLSDLSRYISGINANEFTNIIKHHSMTTNTPPAKWIGRPVDAHRFATFIGMKVSLWNKCFIGLKNKKGNPRPLKDGDKEKQEWKDAPINEILKTHFNK